MSATQGLEDTQEPIWIRGTLDPIANCGCPCIVPSIALTSAAILLGMPYMTRRGEISRRERAICARCGAEKQYVQFPCAQCGFDPTGSLEDMARAAYLSDLRFPSGPERAEYVTELGQLANSIRQGEAMVYDPVELARMRESVRAFDENAPLKVLAKVVLQGLVFIASLFAIGYLIRML